MPNRVLTKEQILSRISEIEGLQKSLPIVKAGDLLQVTKWSLSCEKRRLRLRLSKLNGHHHTLRQAIELIQSVNSICEICGDDSNPSIDHNIPISKGGHNGLENLRVLCVSCNSKKGGRIYG